jgi:hypothetical protein
MDRRQEETMTVATGTATGSCGDCRNCPCRRAVFSSLCKFAIYFFLKIMCIKIKNFTRPNLIIDIAFLLVIL